jgi:hypothetical protein
MEAHGGRGGIAPTHSLPRLKCGRNEKEIQEEGDKGMKGIKDRKKEDEGLRY